MTTRRFAFAFLLLVSLGLASCSSDTPTPAGPEPVPTATPLSESCKLIEPIAMSMKVDGEAGPSVINLGQTAVFKTSPQFKGSLLDKDFDPIVCPQPTVWVWKLKNAAAKGCDEQGSDGDGSLKAACNLPGLLDVEACTVDVDYRTVCGEFHTEVVSQ